MSTRNCRPRLNTCRGTETCTAQTPSTYKVPFSWRPLAEWAQGKQAGWRKWLQPFICLVGFEISFYLEGKAGLKVNFLALENLIVSALSQPIPEPDHSCPSMSHVSKLQSQFERARSVETQGIVKVSIPASVSAERSRLCANTTLNSTPRCWCRWNPRYPGYLFRNGTSRRKSYCHSTHYQRPWQDSPCYKVPPSGVEFMKSWVLLLWFALFCFQIN